MLDLDLDLALRSGATTCPTDRTFTAAVRPAQAGPLPVAGRRVRVTGVTVTGAARCRVTGAVTLRTVPSAGLRAKLRLTTRSTSTIVRTVRVALL